MKRYLLAIMALAALAITERSLATCVEPIPWYLAAEQGIPLHVWRASVVAYRNCVNGVSGSFAERVANQAEQNLGKSLCNRRIQALRNLPGYNFIAGAQLRAECEDGDNAFGIVVNQRPPGGNEITGNPDLSFSEVKLGEDVYGFNFFGNDW